MGKDFSSSLWSRIIQNIGTSEIKKAQVKLPTPPKGRRPSPVRVGRPGAKTMLSGLNRALSSGEDSKNIAVYTKFYTFAADKNLKPEDEERVIRIMRQTAETKKVPFNEQFWRNVFRNLRSSRSIQVASGVNVLAPHGVPGIGSLINTQVVKDKAARWTVDAISFAMDAVNKADPKNIPKWESIEKIILDSAKKRGVNIKQSDLEGVKRAYDYAVKWGRKGYQSIYQQYYTSGGSSWYYSPYTPGRTTEEIEEQNRMYLGTVSSVVNPVLAILNAIEIGGWVVLFGPRHLKFDDKYRDKIKFAGETVDEINAAIKYGLERTIVGWPLKFVVDIPLSFIGGYLRFMGEKPKESFGQEVYKVGSQGAVTVFTEYDMPFTMKAAGFAADLFTPTIPLAKFARGAKIAGGIGARAVRAIPGVDAIANKVTQKVINGRGVVPRTARWAMAGMGVGPHGKAKRETQDLLYEAQKEVMKRKQEIAEKTRKVKITIDRAAARKVTGAAPGETPVETPVWDALREALEVTQQVASRFAQRGIRRSSPTPPTGFWGKAATKAVNLADVASRKAAAAVGKVAGYGKEAADIFREAKISRQEVTGPLWYSGNFRQERARISRGVSEAIDASLEATIQQQRGTIYAAAAKTGVPLDKGVMVRRAVGESDTPFILKSGFTAADRKKFVETTGIRAPFDAAIAASRRSENLFRGAETAKKKFGGDINALFSEFESRSLRYIDVVDRGSFTSRMDTARNFLPQMLARGSAKNVDEAKDALHSIDSIMRDVLRADLQHPRMTIEEREEMFGIWSALRSRLSRRKVVNDKYLSEGGKAVLDDIAQASQEAAKKSDPVNTILKMFQPSGENYEFIGYDINGIKAVFTKEEMARIRQDLAIIMAGVENTEEMHRATRTAIAYLHDKIGTRFTEIATQKMRAEQRANAIEAIKEKLRQMHVSPIDVEMISRAVEDVLKNEEKMGMELLELGIIKNLTHVLGAHVRLRYAYYQNPEDFVKNMEALASAMDNRELRQGFARMNELRGRIERARAENAPTDFLESELESLKRNLKAAAGDNPYIVPMIEAEVPPHALEEVANIARSTMEFYIPGSTAPSVVKRALGYERKRISRQSALKMGREMGFELRASRGLEQVESIEMRKGFDKIHDTFKQAGMVLDEYRPGFSYVVDAPEVYGKLAGKWIPDGAWFAVAELVSEMRASVLKKMRKEVGAGKFEAAMEQLYLMFKLSKTAFDPRTQIVNVISNVVSLNYQAHGLHPSNIDVYAKAFLELAKGKGKYLDAYRQYYPAGLSGMMKAELGIDLLEAENLNWTGLKGAVKDFLIRNVYNRAIKTWEFTEEWAKLAGFIFLREKGVSEMEAAIRATNAIFDYARTPTMLKTITKSPWGVPFISFPYHYTRRFAEALWGNPRRIRNTIFLLTNTPKLWMDADTWSVIQNTLNAQPSYQSEQKIPISVKMEQIGNLQPVPSVKTIPKYPFIPLFGMVGERFGLPMPYIGGTSLEKYEPILRSISPWFLQLLNVFSGRRATGAVAARPELMETIGTTTPQEKPEVFGEAFAFIKNLVKEMGPVPTGIASGTFWWPLRSLLNFGSPFYTEWGQAVGPFGAIGAWMGIRPMEIGTKEWQRYNAAFQEKKRAIQSKVKSMGMKMWRAYDNYTDLKAEGKTPDIAKFIKPSDLNSMYKLTVYAYIFEQKYIKAARLISAFLDKRQRVSVPPPDKIELTPKEIATALERADRDFMEAIRNLRLNEGELWRLQSKLKGRPRKIFSQITGIDQKQEE